MVMSLAYLKMFVDSNLKAAANYIDQEPNHTMKHAYKVTQRSNLQSCYSGFRW